MLRREGGWSGKAKLEPRMPSNASHSYSLQTSFFSGGGIYISIFLSPGNKPGFERHFTFSAHNLGQRLPRFLDQQQDTCSQRSESRPSLRAARAEAMAKPGQPGTSAPFVGDPFHPPPACPSQNPRGLLDFLRHRKESVRPF